MGSVRVVLDTNVLVSALGWGGKPEQCLRRGLRGQVELLGSPDTVSELTRVLGYPKFDFTEREKAAFLSALLERTTIVRPEVDVDEIDADPDDDVFLECAVEGGADALVSGDDHLLELGEYRGIQILTPDEFLRRFD